MVYAEIELINTIESALAKRRDIDEDEVKKMYVTALVDTGCYWLAINENIQEILQLPVIEIKPMLLANEAPILCKIVGPVDIRFKNKVTTTNAVILPGNAEILLGAIPMEALNVVIDPLRQELIVPLDDSIAFNRLPSLKPVELHRKFTYTLSKGLPGNPADSN